jgi:hypothetical protein
MAEQIHGLNEALGELKRIKPELQRVAIKNMKNDLKPIVAAAKAKIPAIALSGWVAPKQTGAPNPRKGKSPLKPYDAQMMRRRTSLSVRNVKSKDKTNQTTLVRLVSAAPTSTAFDMGGKVNRTAFTENLARRFGAPSRFMYPAVEANRNLVNSSLKRSVVSVEQLINEALKDKGKLGRSRPRGSAFMR